MLQDGTHPVLPFAIKDIYTITEAARILHVSETKLYELSRRPVDPFPARRLAFKSRGALVMRDELLQWAMRNALLLSERSAP